MTLAARETVACTWILIENIHAFGNICGSHSLCFLLNKLHLFSLTKLKFILIQCVRVCYLLRSFILSAVHTRHPFVLRSRAQKPNLSHRHGGWFTLSWIQLRKLMPFTILRTQLAHYLFIYLSYSLTLQRRAVTIYTTTFDVKIF